MARNNRGGRPPKPISLHLVEGTFRPDRHGSRSEAEAEFERSLTASAPDPPDWLDKTALEEWARIVGELRQRGLLELVDRAALVGYVQAWSELRAAEAGIRSDVERARRTLADEHATRYAKAEAQSVVDHSGLRMPGREAGTWVQNPTVHVRNAAAKRMKEFLVEFGMTPSSRARLTGAAASVRSESGDFPNELSDVARRRGS